eukprot:7297927-Prymnesium_polylepis.1
MITIAWRAEMHGNVCEWWLCCRRTVVCECRAESISKSLATSVIRRPAPLDTATTHLHVQRTCTPRHHHTTHQGPAQRQRAGRS